MRVANRTKPKTDFGIEVRVFTATTGMNMKELAAKAGVKYTTLVEATTGRCAGIAYVGEYVTHAQDVIGHQFTVAELDMIGSLVSSVQASYRNFDIFTDEAMTARMMKQAEKIDEQLDDAMFYCAYKINSGLLRCCMEHFPEKKELAYTIVARMNKHQERYDGIEFVGKDRRHG